MSERPFRWKFQGGTLDGTERLSGIAGASHYVSLQLERYKRKLMRNENGEIDNVLWTYDGEAAP